MTITLITYKKKKLQRGFFFSNNKLFILIDKEENIFFQTEKNENKEEIALIKKENNFFLLESKSPHLKVNNVNAELVQLETDDVINYMDFEILVKIYPFEIKTAKLIVEDKIPNDYIIFKPLTFIGKKNVADIEAQSKNPFLPISDYSAAIIFREDDYYLVPINPSVVKFKMKELKLDIKLEDNMSFEVGATKFIFKRIQN